MRIKNLILAFIASAMTVPSMAQSHQGMQQRLKDHLYYFAADSLNGRLAGSADAAKAAAYIKKEWSDMGLMPYMDTGYDMPFSTEGQTFCNVVAVIEGKDPILKDEYIVVGAHFDHLGTKDEGTVIYNGADDNASGSSALIELSRNLKERESELKRSVVFAGFDAEELGLYGSNYLAKQMKNKRVRLMISMDMVGWLSTNGELELEGTGTIKNGKQIAELIAEQAGIKVDCKKFESSMFTATDTRGFAKNQFPTLAISTGIKSPYHKPEDTADKIDYAGLTRVTEFATALVREAASNPDFRGSGKLASIHRQRPPFLQVELDAGWGRSYLNYGRKSSVTGKSRVGAEVGLNLKFNMGGITLRPGVELDIDQCWAPSATAAFTDRTRLKINNMTVPVDLIVNGSKNDWAQNFYVGIGGYYSHPLSVKYAGTKYSPEELSLKDGIFGMEALVGFSLGSLSFELQYRSPFECFFETPMEDGPGLDLPGKTRLRGTQFKIGWTF